MEIIDSQEFRIKKINQFLLLNEEKLIKGETIVFNTKYIGDYYSLLEKAGYVVQSIPSTCQINISV